MLHRNKPHACLFQGVECTASKASHETRLATTTRTQGRLDEDIGHFAAAVGRFGANTTVSTADSSTPLHCSISAKLRASLVGVF